MILQNTTLLCVVRFSSNDLLQLYRDFVDTRITQFEIYELRLHCQASGWCVSLGMNKHMSGSILTSSFIQDIYDMQYKWIPIKLCCTE